MKAVGKCFWKENWAGLYLICCDLLMFFIALTRHYLNVERQWFKIRNELKEYDVVITCPRKSGTNGLLALISNLYLSPKYIYEWNSIKENVYGSSPITYFRSGELAIIICHDLPFLKHWILKSNIKIVSSKRNIDDMLTSSLDYYSVRRKNKLFKNPFLVIYFKLIQFQILDNRLIKIHKLNPSFSYHIDFSNLMQLSDEKIKTLAQYLGLRENVFEESSSIIYACNEVYKTSFQAVDYLEGGFSVSKKSYKSWRELPAHSFVERYIRNKIEKVLIDD